MALQADEKIGFIGAGNMAKAIANGLISQGRPHAFVRSYYGRPYWRSVLHSFTLKFGQTEFQVSR